MERKGLLCQQDGDRHFLGVGAQVKRTAVLQREADLIHVLGAELAGGLFQRPVPGKGVVSAIGAQRIELVVRRAAGQAVDPDGRDGLGMEIVKGNGVEPCGRGALPAGCGKGGGG